MMRADRNARRLAILVVLAVLALPALAYEYPLTSGAIRTAYLDGKAGGDESRQFFAQYTHTLRELKLGGCPSMIRIETPFEQIAERARATANYTSQDAVEEFMAKPPARFLMQMDLCFGHTEPQSVKFEVMQNGKKLVPVSIDRSPFFPISDETSAPPSIGEHIHLEFKAEKIDASDLTVKIETVDGREDETTFDLAMLK